MTPRIIMARRVAQLAAGLLLYGFAIALMIRAEIGVAPWDVLGQGVSLTTGLPFGLVTNIVGLVVLLLWIPIRQKPGIGTVFNVAVVGPSAQLGLWLLPEIEGLLPRILLFVAGLLLLGVATGLYLGARFGPGPRDGLMTGIHRKYGGKIWVVRSTIELVVLTIGAVLGGNLGWGTLAFALLIGPIVHFTIPRLMVPAALTPTAESATVAAG
ncbi:membrane protein YczE [Salinibacterium sp. PAMC 21357]|uniref:membrane protein YczE n=1 Tax=Salinibacterium sp. PAMC 21357 TaxID=1112215 RepID=UPI000288E5ED|nr:membrane protein [Salinibacterium sp. PAMC 21357]